MTKQEIVEKVRAAGVVGAGGAGFPTHIKLEADVERVLGNGASCEPLLTSDFFLMENESEGILSGLSMVMQSTGAGRGTLCLKEKHFEALGALEKTISKHKMKDIDIFGLDDFYPAGDEMVLVYEVMNRVVPEGGFPLQVGVVVNNVESLLNIARAVKTDKPVIERYLTVAGEVQKNLVIKVPVGISVGEVINLAGGATISDFKVIVGGPMMGQVVTDLSTPVDKTTSGVIVLPANHNIVAGKTNDPERIRRITRLVCCQCSRCTDLCPRTLLGHSLESHKIMRQLGVGSQLVSEALLEDALICSECGICEKFACPMMISPREVNAQIKREMMEKGVDRSPKKITYQPSAFRDVRKVPTKRLMERLQVSRYDRHPEIFAGEIEVKKATIPLKQHIGAPAIPVVKTGDRVEKGDLIGEIPDKTLGARVHASISGVVESVGTDVVIRQ
ncbi:MAG TPA: electron transport complex protein RnfC [Desulfobacterales bacterium]|nr:electron transport complex protein RnfC [Desulfobacterales bacterium]